MKDHITIAGHDGAFAAYIARPKTVPAPAVIVLQELFGVNADIRKHCDELAEQGMKKNDQIAHQQNRNRTGNPKELWAKQQFASHRRSTSLLHFGSPILRTNSANRGSARKGSSKKSVFNSSKYRSCSW